MSHARLTPEIAVALFHEALKQEFGVRLPVEAGYHDRAVKMIHDAIKDEPERDKIMICAFPEDNEFWFVKKTVEVI